MKLIELLTIIFQSTIVLTNFYLISALSNGSECQTTGCQDAAKLVKGNIDTSKQPCENFYSFACGGFVKTARISKNQDVVDHISLTREKVRKELGQMLEESISAKEPRTFKLVKQFYKACMDEGNYINQCHIGIVDRYQLHGFSASIEKKGIASVLNYTRKLGGWPVLIGDSWNSSGFDVSETLYQMRRIGLRPNAIMDLFVFSDINDTSTNVLYIDSPRLTVHSEDYRQGFLSKKIQAYYQYMVEIATWFGAQEANAVVQMRKVLEVEKAFASAAGIFTSDLSGNNIPVGELAKKIPSLNLYQYLQVMTEPIEKIDLDKNLRIVEPDYLISLEHILHATPKRAMANYLIWKMVEQFVPHLTKKFRMRYHEFMIQKSDRSSATKNIKRHEQCIDLLADDRNGLMVGLGSMYVKKHASSLSKEDLKIIVNDVTDSFKDVIGKADWLDQSSRKAAVDKVTFMGHVIGYPNDMINDQKLDSYTKSLNLSANDAVKNFLNLQRFHYEHSLANLRKPSNRLLWTVLSESIRVNAYYYKTQNIFAAMLQPPIYNPDWPAYAKYGSIGFIVAHEMMHAFDTESYKLDKTGSLKKWMSPASESSYFQLTLCLAKQYHNFKDEDNGLRVADNGGLKVAHIAYKKWIKKNKEEDKLPGLDYTPEQLFWITAMSFLCSKKTYERLFDDFVLEDHTPDEFRAIGMLMNSRSFAKDFQCPTNSRMNPTDKCTIW
uniref:Endothelin-converting enzyme 1 n=1 Tax=Trichogramma kaykai TaxID=54128 RepID=A0ABD2WCJ0_9HYME